MKKYIRTSRGSSGECGGVDGGGEAGDIRGTTSSDGNASRLLGGDKHGTLLQASSAAQDIRQR